MNVNSMTTRRSNVGSNERENLLASSSSTNRNALIGAEKKDGITARVFCNYVLMIACGGCALVALGAFLKNGLDSVRRDGYSSFAFDWQSQSSISYEDVLEARHLTQPEQVRMPMHVFEWGNSNYQNGQSWTITPSGSKNNMDDRSTGADMFLKAVMKAEFSDVHKHIHFGWVSHDYPQNACVDSAGGCGQSKAPIFSFGSVPKDSSKISGLIQAPTLPLTPCIAHAFEPDQYNQCDWFSSPGQCNTDKMFTESTASFDSLIPKMFWRGSDWPYLEEYLSIGTTSGTDFLNRKNLCGASKGDIVNAILNSGSNSGKALENRVPPRLRTVVHAAMNQDDYDIKFTNSNPNAPETLCIQNTLPTFSTETKTACDYAQYKYLLNIGGGGGTSWKTTFWAMGMPGVLFHHETPMRDSFFGKIEAWKHYIPVNEDLTDLDEQLNWAKANPEECKKISERASEFVKYMMTANGLKEHARETFVEPMKNFIQAYNDEADGTMDTRELTIYSSNGKLVAWIYNPQSEPYLAKSETTTYIDDDTF